MSLADGRRLADLTAEEVRGLIASGVRVVLLPFGSTEQHGPHLPLATDTMRAVHLAEEVASRVPEVLLAPPLPYGSSDEHGAFAGLMGFSQRTLANALVDIVERCRWWGVRAVAVLSAHGGNQNALLAAQDRAADEIPGLPLWILGQTAGEALARTARDEGVPLASLGLHAGEHETSEIMALHPNTVRRARIAPGARVSPGSWRPGPRGIVEVAPHGVIGDPRRADASRGRRYLVAQAEALTDELRALIEG